MTMTDLDFAPPYGQGWDEWSRWAECMPTSRMLGLRCTDFALGRAELVMDTSTWHLTPHGAVHGGLVVGCADHCLGVAVLSALDASRVPATASLSSEFLRPAYLPLTFRSQVDRVGRTLAFLTVTVLNRQLKVAAKVNGTMAIDAARPG